MDNLKILYIDDNIDTSISMYLHKHYKSAKYEIEFREITYYPEDGYESIISSTYVMESNIIIIDSNLFENRTAKAGKFTGEEFKVILKKMYPYIEVIIITQNNANESLGIVKKYHNSTTDNPLVYYSSVLGPRIDLAVNEVQVFRELSRILNQNDKIEDVLKEKIINSINGLNIYDDLKKADIDELVLAFKELQVKLL